MQVDVDTGEVDLGELFGLEARTDDGAEDEATGDTPGGDEALDAQRGGDDLTPDEVRAWLHSEEGQRYINRQARRFTRAELRGVERALSGDAQARERLSDRAKRVLTAHERQVAEASVAAQQHQLAVQTEYLRLRELDQTDPGALAQEFDQNPALERWYVDAKQHFRHGITPVATRPGRTDGGSTAADAAWDELVADPSFALLSEEEQDALDPDQWAAQFPNDPARAARAMHRRFGELVAEAKARADGGREAAEPEEALPPARDRRATPRELPPRIATAPAPQRYSDDQIMQQYANNPRDPQARARYEQLRKRNGW